MITSAVSNYCNAVNENIVEQFKNLSEEMSAFTKLLTEKQDELGKLNETMQALVDTGEVAKLANADIQGYIEGVDLKMYRAVQMQYDWDLTKSMEPMTKIYDYDLHYRLNVQ